MKRSRGKHWWVGVSMLLGLTALVVWLGGWLPLDARSAWDGWPMATVLREDVNVELLLAGDVEGGKETKLECELENLGFRGGYGDITVLSVVDDGTPVHKDQVICRFDSSTYEELARLQRIEVLRAISGERQAELSLGAAQADLRAYRDGTAIEEAEGQRGKLALAQADLTRARERSAWSGYMESMGYLSTDQLTAAQIAVQRLELDQLRSRTLYDNHERYNVPRQVREREVRVAYQEDELEFSKTRRTLAEERLEHLEDLISKCEMKAPHDGRLVHYLSYWGNSKLESGSKVWPGYPVFTLPDMTNPVVKIDLPESVASQVAPGQEGEVEFDAFPGQVFHGRLAKVDQLSTETIRTWVSGTPDIKFIGARFELRDAPRDLLPGMTAAVRLYVSNRPDALVLPVQAVGFEKGQTVCYVPGKAGLERRSIELKPIDPDRFEILSGLAEGEPLLLNPQDLPPEVRQDASTPIPPELAPAAAAIPTTPPSDDPA